MMRLFYMTEQPYPAAWAHHKGSLRVNLPNRLCDPKIAADLYHRYYDEFLLCDDLGLNIMVNEHHSTATCMASAAAIPLAILARETKKVKLLVLGYPIAHRTDPLRAAEELATIDVLSRGRLEVGLVKGVPYETPVSNLNPVRIMDRFWESHDLIIKALTSHDEPFSWEGEFYDYRQVNIWPRPWQDPHPPIWVTTSNKTNAMEIARLGYVMATMGTGYASKAVYEAYKEAFAEKTKTEPSLDRFAYLGFLAIGQTEAEARRRAETIAIYPRTSTIVAPPFANAPGLLSVDDNARIMKLGGKPPARTLTKDGRHINPAQASVDDLMDAGLMFCGTPDQVCNQITEFADRIGGFGNVLLMAQAGEFSHADTVDSLQLLAREVAPCLEHYRYNPIEAQSAA